MAKKRKSSSNRKSKNRVLAITALIINILLPLGLGSIIGGKIKSGTWQAILFVIAVIIGLIFSSLGYFLITISWVWGLVTGIKLVQEAN